MDGCGNFSAGRRGGGTGSFAASGGGGAGAGIAAGGGGWGSGKRGTTGLFCSAKGAGSRGWGFFAENTEVVPNLSLKRKEAASGNPDSEEEGGGATPGCPAGAWGAARGEGRNPQYSKPAITASAASPNAHAHREERGGPPASGRA